MKRNVGGLPEGKGSPKANCSLRGECGRPWEPRNILPLQVRVWHVLLLLWYHLQEPPHCPFLVIFLSHYPVVSPCRSGQGRGKCDQHPSAQRPSDVSPAPAPIEPSEGLVGGWYHTGGQGAGQGLPLLPSCGGSSAGPRGAEETNRVKSWQNERGGRKLE